jgi:hypothetical protein
MSAEHPLVRDAAKLGAAPDQVQRVTELAGALQAQLNDAIAERDVAVALTKLTAVRQALSAARVDLVGSGLAYPLWFDQSEFRVYLRAVQLLGDRQVWIPRPHTTPLYPGRGR